MTTVKTDKTNGEVKQYCKKCGSDRVECWFWGKDPIIKYLNTVFGMDKPNPHKQRWSCWSCEMDYDTADMSNAGEWVASEY